MRGVCSDPRLSIGSITATCSSGVTSFSGGSCSPVSPPPLGCGAQVLASGACSYSIPALSDGHTHTANTSTGGYTGQITAFCNSGSLMSGGATCNPAPLPPSGCGAQVLSAGVCSYSFPSLLHGGSATVETHTNARNGAATAVCTNGTLAVTGPYKCDPDSNPLLACTPSDIGMSDWADASSGWPNAGSNGSPTGRAESCGYITRHYSHYVPSLGRRLEGSCPVMMDYGGCPPTPPEAETGDGCDGLMTAHSMGIDGGWYGETGETGGDAFANTYVSYRLACNAAQVVHSCSPQPAAVVGFTGAQFSVPFLAPGASSGAVTSHSNGYSTVASFTCNDGAYSVTHLSGSMVSLPTDASYSLEEGRADAPNAYGRLGAGRWRIPRLEGGTAPFNQAQSAAMSELGSRLASGPASSLENALHDAESEIAAQSVFGSLATDVSAERIVNLPSESRVATVRVTWTAGTPGVDAVRRIWTITLN